MEMTNFYLPDFFFNCKMNKAILDYVKKFPDHMRDDCGIAGVYGVFPSSNWNGEYNVTGSTDRENIEATVKEFNDRGVSLIFEYTNTKLQPFHVYDNYCNLHTRLCENEMNYCCVAADTMSDYISSAYPKYGLISSSAKCIYYKDELQDELNNDEFKYVIANTIFNNDDSIFDLENKDKLILVANDNHKCGCTNEQARCDYASLAQLNLGLANSISPCSGCTQTNDDFYASMKKKQFITVEDIFGKYKDNGITNFYIYGRVQNKLDVLEAYIYYLIKPEYQDKARVAMLIACE